MLYTENVVEKQKNIGLNTNAKAFNLPCAVWRKAHPV